MLQGCRWLATPTIAANVRAAVSRNGNDGPRDPIVLRALSTFDRYGWAEKRITDRVRDNNGRHLDWCITEAGREALERGLAAVQQPKGDEVDTTTQEPPTSSAPWEGEEPETQEPAGDPEALEELDGGEVEGELEEPEDAEHNPPVNEGASQLSLKIGGPKPTASKLKVRAVVLDFGTTKQFEQMKRIPIKGYVELRKVGTEVKDGGKVERFHEAVLVVTKLDDEAID